MKDYTPILIIATIAFLIYSLLQSKTCESYSNTNYQQIPNQARYPNSISDAYILNYQYVYPGPVVGMRDAGKCNTY